MCSSPSSDAADRDPGDRFDPRPWPDEAQEPEAVSPAQQAQADAWVDQMAARRAAPSAADVEAAVDQGTRFGLGLAGLLAARPGPGELSTRELVDHVEGWGRVAAHAQARQGAAVAELLARREADPADPRNPFAKDPWRDACGQVALALRLSPRAAEQVVADSQTLAAWPATATALRVGRIDLATARAIADEASLAAPAYRLVLEAAALALAGEGGTARQVRMFTRRTAIKLDPAAAAARAEAARADRGVSKCEVVDDMGELRATLTATELKTVWDTLTTRAKALPGVDGDGNHVPLDERRATVLVDLITHPEKVRDCDHNDQSRWRTDMVAAASTIAGGDEDPAHLPGYGLVTADTARQIATDSTWRRVDIDTDDHVIGRSPKRHHPPPDRTPPDRPPTGRPPTGPAPASAATAAAAAPVETEAEAPAASAPEPAPQPAPQPAPERAPESARESARDTVLAARVDDLLTEAITAQHAHRSTNRYRPTVAVSDHVEAVHRRCRFPGCRRPAAECDLDHVKAHSAGGATSTCNLIPACRFHHRLKHTDGWTVTLATDRTVTWTTPTGHRYPRPPTHHLGLVTSWEASILTRPSRP